MQQPIYCLMGPTASGKTDLAVQLVERYPFEIISVDSAMVYRGMDIGTAKPSADILKKAPHRLIDICDPSDSYSAAKFCRDALFEIAEIESRGKWPLLVGGTMLYFHALRQGLAAMPAADEKIREKISQEAAQYGWQVMHQRLQKIDPDAAARIHSHDTQRIQRALEVYEISGKNLTEWQQAESTPSSRSFVYWALAPQDRAVLHQRIADRLQKMFAEGFVEEVETLFARGDLSLNCPSIRSVGYRQVWHYLLGEYSYEEMQQRALFASRQLAKRQLTWLRSWKDLQWICAEDIRTSPLPPPVIEKLFVGNCGRGTG